MIFTKFFFLRSFNRLPSYTLLLLSYGKMLCNRNLSEKYFPTKDLYGENAFFYPHHQNFCHLSPTDRVLSEIRFPPTHPKFDLVRNSIFHPPTPNST